VELGLVVAFVERAEGSTPFFFVFYSPLFRAVNRPF
jgi:hypothetical protein